MSRLLWFAAHRGFAAGAGAPRTVGADGRPLLRPWRTRRPEIAQRARGVRAARPQPVWPRMLGIVLIGVAGIAALHPVGPVPTHVAASASTRPGGDLHGLLALAPAGELAAEPVAFHWRAEGVRADEVALVLCDGSYAPRLRLDGVRGSSLPVSGRLAELLANGGTFHWYVEASSDGRVARSAFETFAVR